jgi:hypothetical protein
VGRCRGGRKSIALPDGIHRLITPDYRRRIMPQQSTLGLLWVLLGEKWSRVRPSCASSWRCARRAQASACVMGGGPSSPATEEADCSNVEPRRSADLRRVLHLSKRRPEPDCRASEVAVDCARQAFDPRDLGHPSSGLASTSPSDTANRHGIGLYRRRERFARRPG